jgi:hypothetical protein
LPAAQVALAVALLWWSSVLFFASHRGCDMPGTSPTYRVLLAINAPLFLPRAMWEYYLYLSYIGTNAALIIAVGLFWYWVALNIRSWRRRRAMLMFSWRPARFFLDVFLVIYGGLLALIGMFEGFDAIQAAPSTWHGIGCFGPNFWFDLLPSFVTAGLYLAWALVLVFFFGRDFLYASRRIVQ